VNGIKIVRKTSLILFLANSGGGEGVGLISHDFLIFNVPVVFMARYVMILRGATHYEGHWKGWALKIRLFCALKWQERSQCHLAPKRYKFPTSPIGT
jgi:hypothetical protein